MPIVLAVTGRDYPHGSWLFHDGLMLDLGLSRFDEDLHIKTVDLEAFDANLHRYV